MKRVLVIGDTGGVGQAVAQTLRARGDDVVGLSRSRDGLDVTNEAAVERQLGMLDGFFDLIFVATGEIGRAHV